MDFIIRNIASSITDKTTFRKKLDFIYFLPLISKLEYPKALKFAQKRGRALSKKYKEHFNNAKTNLKKILNLPKDKSEKIAQNLFIKSSYEELEACLIAKRDIKFLKEYVEIQSIENLINATKTQKGIIIVITHVGSFASALCKTAYMIKEKSFHAVSWDYRTSECPITKKFLKAKMDGMQYFYRGEYFFVGKINAKKLFNYLKNGEILIIAIDAPLGKSKFVDINFLGKKVKFPQSAIKIAHKTDSLIIPLAVYRKGIKIVGKYFEPIKIIDENYNKSLQKIFNILEKNIYEHLDEFFYWTSPTSWVTIDQL